jgi:hypothetical protein
MSEDILMILMILIVNCYYSKFSPRVYSRKLERFISRRQLSLSLFFSTQSTSSPSLLQKQLSRSIFFREGIELLLSFGESGAFFFLAEIASVFAKTTIRGKNFAFENQNLDRSMHEFKQHRLIYIFSRSPVDFFYS